MGWKIWRFITCFTKIWMEIWTNGQTSRIFDWSPPISIHNSPLDKEAKTINRYSQSKANYETSSWSIKNNSTLPVYLKGSLNLYPLSIITLRVKLRSVCWNCYSLLAADASPESLSNLYEKIKQNYTGLFFSSWLEPRCWNGWMGMCSNHKCLLPPHQTFLLQRSISTFPKQETLSIDKSGSSIVRPLLSEKKDNSRSRCWILCLLSAASFWKIRLGIQ